MNVPIIDPPEDADSIRELLREVCSRLGICVAALFVGFILSAAPIPYVTDQSITAEVIRHLVPPEPNHECCLKPGEMFAAYFSVAFLVAFALAQPVHIYQLLALVSGGDLRAQRAGRCVALIALHVLFLVGAFLAFRMLQPIPSELLLPPTHLNYSLPEWALRYSYREYMIWASATAYVVGLAFQLPIWMVTLRWLEVVWLERLAKLRPYALLVAVIVAALATPTPDILTMMVVAVPLYLLYEAGLLAARLIPDYK